MLGIRMNRNIDRYKETIYINLPYRWARKSFCFSYMFNDQKIHNYYVLWKSFYHFLYNVCYFMMLFNRFFVHSFPFKHNFPSFLFSPYFQWYFLHYVLLLFFYFMFLWSIHITSHICIYSTSSITFTSHTAQYSYTWVWVFTIKLYGKFFFSFL